MALIDCPECENEVSESAKHCPNCGHPIAHQDEKNNGDVENLIECPDCGSSVSESADNCPECGHDPTKGKPTNPIGCIGCLGQIGLIIIATIIGVAVSELVTEVRDTSEPILIPAAEDNRQAGNIAGFLVSIIFLVLVKITWWYKYLTYNKWAD